MADEVKKDEVEKQKKEAKALERVIEGQNDTFKKHYDFHDLNPEYVFDIELKFPSFLEQARIQSTYENYLGGLGQALPPYERAPFMGMSIIQVVGKKVPDFLKNEKGYPPFDILAKIEEDFIEWMNRFC